MQARLEAAKTNYESANFDGDLKLTADIEAHIFAAAIAKRGGKPTEDVTASIEKIVLPEYLGLIDQKRQIFIHALAENLTVSELNMLTAFNKTPEGKTYTSARVLILRSIYTQSFALTKGANVSAWVDHKDDFEKLGLTFGEQKP